MKLSYNFLENLSKKYGDSFYLLYLDRFMKNYEEFLSSFKNIYSKVKIAYSYKTNYTPVLCRTINKMGGLAEVVSEMEYDLALQIGVNPKDIIVNGPYKPKDALKKFLLNGSLVNVDSFREFKYIMELASKYSSKKFRVGLRINFELESLKISRFGFDIHSKELKEVMNIINSFSNIDLVSIHCHFPNRNVKSFRERTRKLMNFIDKNFKDRPPEYIDIGGGFASKMNKNLSRQFSYKIPTYREYARIVAKSFKERFLNLEKKPTLVLEPGTAIVADTMQFVCKVYSIKNVREHYVAITSGSRLNFSSLCNDLNLPISIYSLRKDNFYDSIDITGYTCIENDYLYKGYQGYLSEDDFIVFDNVGSYSIVFKPPFILPNVPIIAIIGNEIVEVKRKETIEDIFFTFIMEEI